MSKSLNILVKSDFSIEQFVTFVGSKIGCRSVKNNSVDWELYDFWILGLDIAIYKSAGELLNDFDIELSEYDFAISLVASNRISEEYRDNLASVFSMVLAEIISKDLGTESVVIEDMSILLHHFRS